MSGDHALPLEFVKDCETHERGERDATPSTPQPSATAMEFRSVRYFAWRGVAALGSEWDPGATDSDVSSTPNES